MSDILLEARDLNIHFQTKEGVVKAADGVDLKIKRGKTLCLVGESGCGKSITARAFLQIIPPPGKLVSGQILFHRHTVNGQTDAVDLAAMNPKGREIRAIRGKEISMIFQEPMTSLSLMHTVGNQIMEVIMLHEKVSKIEAKNRAVELLGLVGIPRPEVRVNEYPFRLSGGMRQRAMIAMALACNPTLLIADEPTTALDVTTQANIIDLMRDLQQRYNMTLLFITHDLGVVAEIADEVAVMYLGKIVEHADADTIFNHPKHPYTQALLRSIPKIAMQREELDPIKGMIPSPYRRPSGCSFHPRCTQAMDHCKQIVPSVTTLKENHSIRCLLYEDVASVEAVRYG
jgi:oligopeptide/dipeptide ABC transporter ATP-binding protein